MYLKLMGAENAPDGDSRKSHRILANVAAVNFVRVEKDEGPEEGVFAFVTYTPDIDGIETFHLVGNAYVLNDNGDTIDHFGPMPFAPQEFPAAV